MTAFPAPLPDARGLVVPAARRAALTAVVFAGTFLLVLLLSRAGVLGSPVGSLTMKEQSAPSTASAKLDRLTERYGCETGSLGAGVIPAHTIVQDASGQVRLTSFDEGWAIHAKQGTPKAAGVLLAVCRR